MGFVYEAWFLEKEDLQISNLQRCCNPLASAVLGGVWRCTIHSITFGACGVSFWRRRRFQIFSWPIALWEKFSPKSSRTSTHVCQCCHGINWKCALKNPAPPLIIGTTCPIDCSNRPGPGSKSEASRFHENRSFIVGRIPTHRCFPYFTVWDSHMPRPRKTFTELLPVTFPTDASAFGRRNG